MNMEIVGIIFKIVAFPFVIGIKFIAFIAEEFIEALFSEEKIINKFFMILPGISVIFAIGVFLYSVINYAKSGGYTEVFHYISENGVFADEEQILVDGNSGNFYKVGIFSVFVLMTVGGILYSIVNFLKKTRGVKRVMFAIFAVLACISMILLLVSAIEITTTMHPENISKLKRSMYRGSFFEWLKDLTGVTFLFGHYTAETFCYITSVVAIVSLIILYLFLSTEKDCNYYAMELLVGLYVNMIFFPLVTITVENVVGLIAILGGVLVVVIIAIFTGGFALSDISSREFGGSSSTGGPKISREEKKRQDRMSYLRNNIEANEKGLREHARGTVGYGHVNEKTTMNTIANNLKELNMLEQQSGKK